MIANLVDENVSVKKHTYLNSRFDFSFKYSQVTQQILTWGTVISINRTIPSLITPCTNTMIRSIRILARRSIATRRRHLTLIHILFTKSSRITPAARAREIQIIRTGHTAGIVSATIRRARIQFLLAICAGERQLADTFVTVDLIDTRTAIFTWIYRTIVDVCFAIDAGIAGRAFACVRGELIATDAAVLTWIWGAFVDVVLALSATIA